MGGDFDDDISAVGRIAEVERILKAICGTTGLGFSAVARVTESRWIACAVRDEIEFGLAPGGELVVDTTICDEIRRNRELVVIDDAEADERFRTHPTPRMYRFRSYISVPIILSDGRFFGTLCAIDPRPAQLKKGEAVEMFRLFASLIAMHLETQLKLIASEKALLGEREAAQLREQFIAVLGHDLRNPLGAIRTGALILGGMIQDRRADAVRGLIERSVARMAEMIDNVMDLARGRLGGGISLERTLDDGLGAGIDQVVEEIAVASPGRSVLREIAVDKAVYCDKARVCQLVSNILANALVHGDPASPVLVRAGTTGDAFEVSIENRGATIPAEVASQLFQPFFRGSEKPGQQGLGLGLYIAHLIAQAHDGTLTVESSEGATKFSLRIPLG